MKRFWMAAALACACRFAAAGEAPVELRYEAEKVVVNPEALSKDKLQPNLWNLWGTDVNAAQKWSGGVVIQGHVIDKDGKPEDLEPVLKFEIPAPPPGLYDLSAGIGRTVGISFDDGKTWRRQAGGLIREAVSVKDDAPIRFWIANCFVDRGGAGHPYVDYFTLKTHVVRPLVVDNADFEQGELGKAAPRWNFWKRNAEAASKAELVADAHAGKGAVRIVAADPRDWALTSSNSFRVNPGDGFEATVWAKKNGDEGMDATFQAAGYLDNQIVDYAMGHATLRNVGREWTEVKMLIAVPEGVNRFVLRFIGSDKCDISLDDVTLVRSAEAKTVAANLAPPPQPKAKQPHKQVEGFAAAKARVAETLDRGLVALPAEDGAVYLSWRLLASDDPKAAFDVFSVVGGKETKLNARPVVQTTDFVVEKPAAEATYFVRPFGRPDGASASVGAEPQAAKIFKLSDETAVVHKIGIGDLDGDGRYDYVVRYGNANVDPWYLFWKASDKPLVLEAVNADGKTLWTKNLTYNIESGIWYAPYVVHDIDGDGKAEVILKAFDDAAGDLREQDGPDKGKVMKGEEFLIVLDGATGREKARAPWPPRSAFAGIQHDYNYYSRNQIAIAYLDGKTPCVLALRGTYQRMLCDAWQLKDGKLERVWQYDNEGWGRLFWGQGAHSTRCVDLDGDGNDEIILGGAVLDDDGQPLWSTTHGHPDYVFVGDLNPANPGMEVLTIYEYATQTGGYTQAAAADGKVVWESKEPAKHIHFGYAADMDPTRRGWEFGGTDTGGGHEAQRDLTRHYAADGALLAKGMDAPYRDSPKFLYWDADLQRELAVNVVRDHEGGPAGGGFIGRFIMQADVLGDWREEALTAVRGELRIYSTTIPAMDRRVCLMQDPIYRNCVTSNAMGYIYDPTHRELFTSVAPNLNLTWMDKPKDPILRVTVSAPLDRGVKGTVRLAPPGAVKLDRTEWAVDLAAGGLETIEVKATRPFEEYRPIKAEWTLADGAVLRGRVPLGLKPAPKREVAGVVTGAETFTGQAGGQVQVRADKIGAHGKPISHWDKEGHELTWSVNVPEAGRYILVVRYTCETDAKRRIAVGGNDLGEFLLPGTGGLGNAAEDWQDFRVGKNGGAMVLTLPAGPTEVKIGNVGGTTMNMDYLQLLPAK